MIFDSLANADRYSALHSLFPRAFEFLRRTDFSGLQPGRHAIDGDRLFAILESAPGRSRDVARLERHKRYIDIQYVLEGIDEMGWRPVQECRQADAEFDANRDIQFFGDAPHSWIATPPGTFCLFFPEDAHAPMVSTGGIRKVIVKIEV